MKVTKRELRELIQKTLREQMEMSSYEENSGAATAPVETPEKLFPTTDIDLIRKWMKQVNDIINEMKARKYIGQLSLGGGISSHSHMTEEYAMGLMAALRYDLQREKQRANQGKQRLKKKP